MLALLAVPVGQAAILQDATLDLVVPLPVENLQRNITLSASCAGTPAIPNNPNPPAETGNISADAAEQAFTFSESATGTGCAIATFALAPPVGARDVTLSFSADRRVTQSQGLNFSVLMPQEVWFFDRPGHAIAVVPYFPANQRVDQPMQAFAFSFALAGASAPAIGFYFEDQGPQVEQTLPNPGLQQTFEATVRQPSLRFEGVPMAGVQEVAAGIETLPDRLLNVTLLQVPVSQEMAASGFALTFLAGPDVQSIAGPDGRMLDPSGYGVESQGALATLRVDEAAVANHGAGTYAIRLASSMPLPPPPPGPPATVPWLPPAAVLMVAAAGGVATPAALRTRARAHPTVRRRADLNVAGTGLLWLAAVLLALLALAALGWTQLVELPISNAALAAYAGVVLLALLFLAILQGSGAIATASHLAVQRAQAEALARSNKELESFAYVASHDLQEPLRKVASYSQLLEERFSDKLGKDGREFIGYTVDGSKRMQALIRDLLAYSRITQSPRPLAAVDLSTVLRRVLSDLDSRIREAKATVEVGAMPSVVGDETQLGQLFQNLVGNAIKYRAPDRRPEVRVSAKPAPGGFTIQVADNGIGIAPEHHEKVFQMFQRLHGRGEYEGTGIGLAITKRIVERHGGSIRIESEPGKGSTFLVTLRGVP